jgi:hypothetical protein
MKVKVYYNIRKGVFSIVACEGKHRNHVIGYAKEVFLEECLQSISQRPSKGARKPPEERSCLRLWYPMY